MINKKFFRSITVTVIFTLAFQLTTLGQSSKSFYELSNLNNYTPLDTNFNFWNDFNNGIDDFGNYFTSPLHFSKNTWVKIGGVTAIAGLSFFADNSVRTAVSKNHSTFQDNLVKIGDNYGKGIIPAGLAVGLYGIGFFTNNYEIKSTGQILFESLAAAGITVTALKVIIGRSRPYLEQGNHNFSPFNTDNDYNSLPSGHVIVAFTTSTVLAEKIDNVYASIALYGLATLTAYQRIYSDNHWFSDTFLGAVLGVAIGKYFVHLDNKRRDHNESKFSYHLSPNLINGGLGINFSLTF